MEKIQINLSNYNGSFIKVLGKCKLKCYFENVMVEYIDFIAVDEQSQPIILFTTMRKLHLVINCMKKSKYNGRPRIQMIQINK